MASRTARKRNTKRKLAPPKTKNWLDYYMGREILALVLGGGSIVFLLALISYSPSQLPAWVPFSRGGDDIEAGKNFVGPLGSIVAGYSYFFFGAAGYLVSPVLLWWAYQAVTRGKILHSRNLVSLVDLLSPRQGAM